MLALGIVIATENVTGFPLGFDRSHRASQQMPTEIRMTNGVGDDAPAGRAWFLLLAQR